MCEFLKRFFACLKPIVEDLDNKKTELDNIKEELDNINEFIDHVMDDEKKIGEYSNQTLIHQALGILDSEVSEYKAMVYLIEADNQNIQRLPQYQNAVQYLRKILKYFNVRLEDLTTLYKKLNSEYHYKEIAKKYYDLFQKEGMYIDDNDEFIELLLSLEISDNDKRDILSYVIKMNVDYYVTNLNEEFEIDKEQDLRKIQEIIHSNKNLLTNEYLSFVEKIGKYVNLSLPIKKIINYDILEKIDINNILLAKIIYLINQISQNYKSCSFGLVSKYIKEYDELMILKEKLSENKEKEEIIKIIRGGY